MYQSNMDFNMDYSQFPHFFVLAAQDYLKDWRRA